MVGDRMRVECAVGDGLDSCGDEGATGIPCRFNEFI